MQLTIESNIHFMHGKEKWRATFATIHLGWNSMSSPIPTLKSAHHILSDTMRIVYSSNIVLWLLYFIYMRVLLIKIR